ncbi:MAG: hypothetical protein NWS89_01380 [Flavobacteriales bacterium]|nr:hypothetical protein [Flavobacteriales bacterium]
MKGVFFFLGLTFYCLISSAQESVPIRLNDIKPNRQLTNFLELNSDERAKPTNNYQLILSHGKWYAIGNGDGQVFTPENGLWKRIDKTLLEGYHYGAFLFDCNGTLMKYGGYGFWRNHGMFVYFHEQTGDWQIQPSDRELPFNGNLAYFSKKENTLYSFGNFMYNQSMSEEKKFLDSLYRIDLLKMKWESLGKLNSNLVDKYHLHYRLHTLAGNGGCFVQPTSNDSTALFLNFETLKYNVYNSKNNSRLFRFFKELPVNEQVYSDSYGLKILDMEVLENVDSISWEEATAQPLESSDLIYKQAATVDFKFSILLGALGFAFGVFLLYFFYKRKKSSVKMNTETATYQTSVKLNLSILNTIVFEGAMYPIDSADYIVIRKFTEQDATTIELNDWLGLENKQPENQKKQRAEWIKRLNSFFNQIGFKEEAFNRERQETDKRMFVYKMNNKLKANDVLDDSETTK